MDEKNFAKKINEKSVQKIHISHYIFDNVFGSSIAPSKVTQCVGHMY